jgi:2-polyprenyl-6-methoxyphenol hydroxylase-like FAD-dependent oxidoreductase
MYFVMGGKAFLGYWAEPGGQISWFVNLPHPQALSAEEARAVPKAAWLAELRECFAGDVPGEALMNSLDADQLETFGRLEILPKVPRWHRGRMVLVGDAAHAPSPSSGQGASLTIESAVQLGRCLRDLPDAPSAFAAYEALRRPRAEMIIDAAAKTNRRKAPGAVMRRLMPLLMKVMNLEKRMSAEQGYRIDWDERVTGASPARVPSLP